MLKHILVVFISGVLLREAYADIECFLEAIGGEIKVDPSTACNGFVDSLKEKLESCSVTTVNLDKLGNYINELCTEGSQLRKDFMSNAECFQNHGPDLMKCIPQVNSGQASFKEAMKKSCLQRHSFYSCFKNAIGVPCGETALNVVTKEIDANESYMKDICALVGGASANRIFMWICILCVSITMLMSY